MGTSNLYEGWRTQLLYKITWLANINGKETQRNKYLNDMDCKWCLTPTLSRTRRPINKLQKHMIDREFRDSMTAGSLIQIPYDVNPEDVKGLYLFQKKVSLPVTLEARREMYTDRKNNDNTIKKGERFVVYRKGDKSGEFGLQYIGKDMKLVDLDNSFDRTYHISEYAWEWVQNLASC